MKDALYSILTIPGLTIPNNEVPNLPNTPLDQTTVDTAATAVFAVAGAICVIFIIIGGIKYIISGGDTAAVQGAKNTILYAVIGLVLVLSAFIIVQIIIGVGQGTI